MASLCRVPEAERDPAIRVLLCDDALGFPRVVASWLARGDGFEYLGLAHSATELLEVAGDLAPDVVLLDYMLPEGPASPELVARLRALARRTRDPAPRTVMVGDLSIDVESYVATRAGHRIELTPRECAVLVCLAQRAGRVVAREDILASVWGEDFDGAANVVDVYVGYLRRKLDRSFDRKRIRTVRGVGFLLEPR